MRLLRPLRVVGLAVLIVLVVGGLIGYFALRASLPKLDGNVADANISAPASIERDAEGTPVIRASNRADLAFATGYAHAQDRYFQMDLMRRAAAGEMAELLGASVLDTDRNLRLHGFRRVARQVLSTSSASDRALLDAYSAGVNYALSEASAKPWEYLLLGAKPAPWLPEDSVLAAFSMYLNLNDSSGSEELSRLQLRDALPPAMFAFLAPLGTEWDAPMSGGTIRSATIPGPDVFDLRDGGSRAAALIAPRSTEIMEEKVYVGSNSWAVASSHTADKGALLANDMHLGLRLPHVWYRARMIVDAEGDAHRDLVGVTLPGLPLLIVGSNGRVAWGFTNSFGDWTDLVIVERDPQDHSRYLTPDGSEPFEVREEVLKVKDGDDEKLTVTNTRWGPVVREDTSNRPLALAWTAQHAQATNLRMFDLETVDSVENALLAANRAGVPVQNFMAVDATGRIGWTLMGQVPVRGNYDSTMPYLWNTPDAGWNGWRKPEEYPRIIDPQSGRLWTANARTVDVETWLSFMGDGMYDNGARAGQIRDNLLALESATAHDMVNIQLDDRALFLIRWRDFLLELLNEESVRSQPLRAEARKFLEEWTARAAAEDVGYRLVRAMRLRIRQDVFESLTAAARLKYPQTKFSPSAQFEGPLWQLVTKRPAHMLDPRYSNWDDALLASIDTALTELVSECGSLSQCTWGAQNTLAMRHPLSQAIPWVGPWLDMPATPLSGDSFMPRVQGPAFGASERMVVSPGREAAGYFQMPGGPVDHPMSPFYGAGHKAWARGEPRPLLPGAPKYTLKLSPAANAKH
jgi:penicillin amidase